MFEILLYRPSYNCDAADSSELAMLEDLKRKAYLYEKDMQYGQQELDRFQTDMLGLWGGMQGDIKWVIIITAIWLDMIPPIFHNRTTQNWSADDFSADHNLHHIFQRFIMKFFTWVGIGMVYKLKQKYLYPKTIQPPMCCYLQLVYCFVFLFFSTIPVRYHSVQRKVQWSVNWSQWMTP